MIRVLFTLALLSYAAKAGTIHLTNKNVYITGPTKGKQLTFNSGKFRYWNSVNSKLNWNLDAKASGEIEIFLDQSYKSDKTSKLAVSFAGSLLKGKVVNTGSWETFKKVSIGKLKFNKGNHTLSLRALDKPGPSVMDLRKITLSGDTSLLKVLKPKITPLPANPFAAKPGRLKKLKTPHPMTTVTDITPEGLNLKINGMDFLSDGTLVVGSWDTTGSVYLIKNYDNPKTRSIKRFAWGIHEPLGLKVIEDEIYVVQKQELTKLEDTDNDGICDFYRNICNAWDVSSNFHEFTFGPVYKNGKFYLALAVAINPGGATTNPQVKDRGCLIEIDPKTGKYKVVSSGLRTPNGFGTLSDGTILISDNQGDFLPASKVMHMRPGAFYNHKYNPPHPWVNKEITQPIAWLPQSEIGNSPTDMIEIKSGPYKGDILCGDIHNGGYRRLALEEINGELQAAVFHFSQGLRGGTNRIIRDPKGNLVVGVNGNRGNWGTGKRNGLLKLEWNNKLPFEMRRIRTLSNGLEIEFTKPLNEKVGWDSSYFQVNTWTYKPTVKYGGPKVDRKEMSIQSATVSEDRKSVFLEISGLKPKYLAHVILHDDLVSENGEKAFAPQSWLTINNIPTNKNGIIKPKPNHAIVLNQIKKITDPRHIQLYKTMCSSCHTLDGKKLVGPSLKGLLGKKQTVIDSQGNRKEITIDRAYLKEAIINPAAVYPEGYQPIMSNLSAAMTPKEIEDLINWIAKMK